jgi:hypothetical protein
MLLQTRTAVHAASSISIARVSLLVVIRTLWRMRIAVVLEMGWGWGLRWVRYEKTNILLEERGLGGMRVRVTVGRLWRGMG